jgi:heptaprenyl diphosphate synthase
MARSRPSGPTSSIAAVSVATTPVMRDPGLDLARVEAVVARELGRLPSALAQPCRRIAEAGGKRLRATLVLASAAALAAAPAPPGDEVVEAAAAVELLHLATLVHDDLLDGAVVRRGVPTVNAAEGPGTAVLVGDVLIAVAGRLAVSVGAGAGLLIHDVLTEMCAAQAQESRGRHHAGLTLEEAVAVAEGKAGTLLAAACQLGAMLVRPDDGDLAGRLAEFGRRFGTCLQLLDDILDVVSSESLCGKPVGVDFAAGTLTMPAIVAMGESGELRELCRPELTDSERERALTLVRSSTGVAATLWCAAEQMRRAEEVLLCAEPARDASALAHLAAMPRRFLAQQVRLVRPEYRHLLGDDQPWLREH